MYAIRSYYGYDLIQLALIDAAGASAAGLYALNESYLYTREAMSLYLSRLAPGVITSYSIHYTKLYDPAGPMPSGPPRRWRRVSACPAAAA